MVEFVWLCCVESGRPARDRSAPSRLDGAGEFGERGFDPTMRRCFDAEFVVAAADVLHQRVTANDDVRGLVAFETAHWP